MRPVKEYKLKQRVNSSLYIRQDCTLQLAQVTYIQGTSRVDEVMHVFDQHANNAQCVADRNEYVARFLTERAVTATLGRLAKRR